MTTTEQVYLDCLSLITERKKVFNNLTCISQKRMSSVLTKTGPDPGCHLSSDITHQDSNKQVNGIVQQEQRSEPDGQSTHGCTGTLSGQISNYSDTNSPIIGENNNLNPCNKLENGLHIHNSTSSTEHKSNSPTPAKETPPLAEHVNGTDLPPDGGEAMDMVNTDIPIRSHKGRDFRHARSEILNSELYRRRSASMMEVKEQAHGRLQEELDKAQTELKLKDEECEKLGKVRDQMCQEIEELTACLFEEANNMVQEANVKRMHAEKLQSEAANKIEMLQAEVLALKQIVLTSTPSTPNKHLHPQIETSPTTKKKESRPFWKGHRRSTSHHEFTKESRQEAEARQDSPIRVVEVDPVCYREFRSWRQSPQLARNCPFLSRVVFEDIAPCLNFASKQLAERVQQCVENNTLTIEPIAGDSSFPRKCSLSESPKLCNYKIRLGEDTRWYPISQHCRNRIASVCDFYTYIRYIYQGLVKSEDKDTFNEILRLRRQMALSRLGLL